MGVVQIRKSGLGAVLAAGLLLALFGPAQAAGDSIDQSQTIASGSNTLGRMAQTFTAGATGQIDRVSLMATTTSGAVSVTVALQTVSAGKPSGNVLGSSSFSGLILCCHAWHDFAFSPAVSVVSGTQYAIVLNTVGGRFTWYDSFSFDTYTAGQLWLASGSTWLTGNSFGRDFCFETWVLSGAANRPPAVTTAATVVTASEGSAVSNTGTYSDPDGDAVALSASAGTLTKTGTSSGSWTWSQPPADEAPAKTITITATDGKGGTSTASFNVTIAGVPPSVTITGAPASGPEGTAIQLTGKATSPSAEDNAAGFTLNWNVSKDGAPFANGSGGSLSLTPDDEGAFAVTLQAVDDGGNSATATTTITGANVAPSAVISTSHDTLVLVALQPIAFDGGFTDPGKLDTHTSTFSYGDGSSTDTTTYGAGGTGQTDETYVYAAAGTYQVTYTVADDDGGTSVATATMVVQTPATAIGAIDAYVQSMPGLTGGEKNSLSAKLRAAGASAARGDTNATCGQLDSVLNDLSAMAANGRLSATDSAPLSSSVWAVHRALGCTKVKVGWLTLTL